MAKSTVRTVGSVVSDIFRSLAALSRKVADSFDQVVDFAYVKVFGVPFVVLGYRQTGKTTLLEWLRSDLSMLEDFAPDPTAAGGDPVPAFTTKISADGGGMRLKPRRDVGGEYAMWDTDWVELFQQTKPRGIIFLIDHEHPYQHKDALNFVLQMLDDEAAARKPLQYFMLLVNKSDLWAEYQTFDEILDQFRNETRRLASQADRLGYKFEVRQTSLVTEDGIRDAMVSFFDAIRPRSSVSAETPDVAKSNGRKK